MNAHGHGVAMPNGVATPFFAFFMRCLCFFLGCCGLLGFVQVAVAQAPPRPIERQTWQRATQGLDYSKDVPPPPRPPRTVSEKDGLNWTWNTELWGYIAQLLTVVLLIVLIGWGIYRMIQQPPNTRIARDGVEITLDNLDHYLDETDLEPFIQRALANKDYAQAVRLYYLRVIQGLSTQGYIQWAREKTNRTYLREMRPHADFAAFQSITRVYERVWYGNAPLREAEFERVSAPFRALADKLHTV